jgi:CPA2 family monovalent cation:H+ antiporter-2
MQHGLILLRDLVVLLALSVPVVAVAHRLRIPSIVGFLLVGVVVGPHGFAFLGHPEEVRELAEVGVILLLFTIGLELSLSQIMKLGRTVIQGGGLQVGLTIVVVALAAQMSWGTPLNRALFYGGLIALSSTAVVLRAYADRGELDTPSGRVAVSILLFQDLCVVPLMLLVPALATAGSDEAVRWDALAWSLAAVVGLLVLGRFVFPRILEQVVLLRNRELFTLCIGLLGLLAAFITASVGLSLALGAFLAGLLISESDYGLQALSDILPFRDTFSGIFFMSVGMLLDTRWVLSSFSEVVGITLFVIVVKVVVTMAVALTLRRSVQVSLVSGLGLAQVGEFSFVLANVGQPLGLFSGNDYQLFLSASVLSMLFTPFLITGARPVADAVARLLRRPVLELLPYQQDAIAELRDHAIIVGYGLIGRHLTRVMRAAQIPYVVLEQNGQQVRRAREKGVNILFGDGTRREVMERVGVDHARVVVFAIASLTDERRGVAITRHLNPAVRIVVRTRYVKAIEDLMQLGATEVVVDEFEASLELFARILEFYEIPSNVVHRELDIVRGEHYSVLREEKETRPDLKLDALRHLGIHNALDLIEVEEGAEAVGSNPASMQLRSKTGAVVIAVIRDGKATYRHDPTFQFRSGDTVVLVGEGDALLRGSALFRASDRAD